jgi:cytochrome P450
MMTFATSGYCYASAILETELCRTKEAINVAELGNDALLPSVVAEETRLRVLGWIPRLTVEDNFRIGEWSIPKGVMIAIPSHAEAMDSEAWNAGTEDDPHPLDEFWADPRG